MSNIETEQNEKGFKCWKCGQMKKDIARMNENTGFVICGDCFSGLEKKDRIPFYIETTPGGKNPFVT